MAYSSKSLPCEIRVNGPVTPEADEIIFKKGIVTVPDILANVGGVTVSYFEQVQNAANYYWEAADVKTKLKKIMVQAFKDMWTVRTKYKIDSRTATQVVAIKKIAQAVKERGI